MNDTFAGLENEFQEANEKFDVLLSMPINDDDDKEETNLLHNLQKAKFIAEAAIENGKSEVEFSDDDATIDEAVILALNALELYVDKLNATNTHFMSRKTKSEDKASPINEDYNMNDFPHSTSSVDMEEKIDDTKTEKILTEESDTLKSSSRDKFIQNLQNKLFEKNQIIEHLQSETADRSNLLDACSDEIQRLIAKYEELLVENNNMREMLSTLLDEKNVGKFSIAKTEKKIEDDDDDIAFRNIPRNIPIPINKKNESHDKVATTEKKRTKKKKPSRSTRGNYMKFSSPSSKNKEHLQRSFHQTPQYRQTVRHQRSAAKLSVTQQKKVATKTKPGHFSYVLPGKKGTEDNNPIVEFNRGRTKIDFNIPRRQSIVAPEELLKGKKQLIHLRI